MLRKTLLLAVAGAAVIAATPASATLVTSIRINNSGAAGPNQSFLQVAEFQAFSGGVNVAPTATVTASSVYSDTFGGPSTDAGKAIDGFTAGLYGVDNFYHSTTAATSEFLNFAFSAPTEISRLTIFGRSDNCCTFRDSYVYTLLNGTTTVGSGTLDASGASRIATTAVPEPATWAMMIGGLGLVGGALRRRNTRTTVRFA